MKFQTSYHQGRILFIDQFERNNLYESSPIYHNVPLILELEGPLDIPVLEQSIKEVISRHEALRTCISTEEEKAFQVIKEEIPFSLKIEDLTGDGPTKEAVLERALDHSKKPFLIEGEPLIRGALFQYETERAVLVLTIHHIIVDKYSLDIITRELSILYTNIIEDFGTKSTIDPPELHYADFSEWQKELPEETLESFLFYWKRKLNGKLQALEMATDYPRVAIHIYKEGHIPFSLPEALGEKIKTFAREKDSETRLVLMTAFNILMHRYSGLEEIMTGTSFVNRTQPGTAGIVGPVANLSPLRNFINENGTFEDALCEVSKTFKDAETYKDIPFDKLVLEINPENDMSRTALFDVLFQYEYKNKDIIKAGPLSIKQVEVNLGWGKNDLNLLIQESDSAIEGVLTYNIDYYNPQTMERLIGHYTTLLEAFFAAPETPVCKLEYITPGEKQKVLKKQPLFIADYPEDICIHQLFEKQAAETPDRIALVCGEEQLTYKEVNKRANQLAALMRAKGAGRESIIALAIERSNMMVIAMLAAMKAGGAYLPIDPEYPEERIEYILEDSGADIFITSEKIKDIITFEKPVIRIEDGEIQKQADTNLENINAPEDLIYIIYTSGTTGKPKGVTLEHGNVVRLMKNDKFQFDFSEKDVWTLFHSYNFDFSVWEMYGALLYGGKLIVIPKELARDTQGFYNILVDQKVTVLNQTPPAFYNLINAALQYKDPLNLRYVIFGGDALQPVKLKEWKETYPDTKLINMYGITETTVHVTYKEITSLEIESNISNIGSPIPTLSAYVVDPHLNLQPIGVPGELLVGGKGVARGYLNRPELTETRFIDNPHNQGERLYRSGDLVKMLDNGEMEYLGRIDHQVKIRGFRIELGEIESTILMDKGVDKTIVTAREDIPGDKRLVAYIVWKEGVSQNINTLQNIIRKELPDYMMPSAFVTLTTMPLTANGKVDRKSLPAPSDSSMDRTNKFVAPGTETEKGIAALWQEMIGIEKVGITDNFFLIGGNSLVVTKLIFKFNELFNVNMPFPTFFTNPTIQAMAEFISKENPRPCGAQTVDFEKETNLDDSISWKGPRNYTSLDEAKTIFLTGATGFLGAFLLGELLETTKAEVICLVRAEDEKKGFDRLKNNLIYYKVWKDTYGSRIKPAAGDLEKPLLGLDSNTFEELTKNVDVIFHNGAVAQFVYPYEKLKGPNVDGTKEILRLASTSKLKQVHYVSTVSVFNIPREEPISERAIPGVEEIQYANGYGQSKWVAEALVRKAGGAGIPVSIYRPGRIVGHTQTGACQIHDFLWQMINVSLEVETIFDKELAIGLVPVDYVSGAIVSIAKKAASDGGSFNLVDPKPGKSADITRWINNFGYPIEERPYKEWYLQIKEKAQSDPKSVSAGLLPLLSPEGLPLEGDILYDNSSTEELLAEDDIQLPKVDEQLFKINFDFLKNVNFLAKQK